MTKSFINLLFIAFLTSQSAIAEDGTVKVGVLASLTGNWAEIGRNIEQGVTLAGEEVKAKSGIIGKKLKFDVQDTDEEKSGAKVIGAYRHLQQQHIKFFVGPTGVPEIMALTPIATKDDMILLAPTSTNSFYRDSAKFFNASGDNYITTKAAAVRAYERGFRKVAIFGSLQPWENDQADIFKREFTTLGGSIVAEEYPAADQADLRMEATRISKAQPDAVFFAIFNQVAIAAKALKQRNFKGGKLAAIMDNSHAAASGDALNGTELYVFSPPGDAFISRFKKRFSNEPGVFADSAYDAVISLAAAVNAAGSVDTDTVIKELNQVRFIGSSGKEVGYDTDGLIAREIVRYEIVNGRLERRSS
jgi:branched-chain amino acid transport system substrate-binding protein